MVAEHPRFLIIDELDKMKGEDYSVLLSLMQSGVVARMKSGLRDINQMTTWVFAGVNRSDKLPPELLSRFVVFNFQTYTREDFLEAAQEVITRQHGKDPALARYIAERQSLSAPKTSARPSRWPSSATHQKRSTGLKVGDDEASTLEE